MTDGKRTFILNNRRKPVNCHHCQGKIHAGELVISKPGGSIRGKRGIRYVLKRKYFHFFCWRNLWRD